MVVDSFSANVTCLFVVGATALGCQVKFESFLEVTISRNRESNVAMESVPLPHGLPNQVLVTVAEILPAGNTSSITIHHVIFTTVATFTTGTTNTTNISRLLFIAIGVGDQLGVELNQSILLQSKHFSTFVQLVVLTKSLATPQIRKILNEYVAIISTTLVCSRSISFSNKIQSVISLGLMDLSKCSVFDMQKNEVT